MVENDIWQRCCGWAQVVIFPVVLVVLFVILLSPGPSRAGEALVESAAVSDSTLFADEVTEDPEPLREYVADPLERLNRFFFSFNDKVYFWLLKPVATGYRVVVPKPARISVGNFFFNLKSPSRLVNSLLQAKFGRGRDEFTRFVVNSTIGVAGLWDPARSWFNLAPSDEDLGQTLGKYGMGNGIYLCLPVLGPASLRDGVGLLGDYFLDPVSYLYLNNENEAALGIRSEETVNRTSLTLGDYEDFKSATFDPYSAMRDSYIQLRNSKINDEHEH
ncbi:MAG: VacJ family lipoprotein [Desulfobulbaceae bacterium]|nr:VacJ family lipoprotein [Desulfobulbaceae bacterium]